jgi:hypothetical protein
LIWPSRIASSLLVLLGLLGASGGAAESALRLPLPEAFGDIVADTYDEAGLRVGDAQLHMLRLDDGLVELVASSGIEGAERTTATARLAEGETSLRPVYQSSQSIDAEGNALGLLAVDHERREATCTHATTGKQEHIELPEGDRVANVPLNLLFLPLVRGETEVIDFQFVLCRFGARLIKAQAQVAERRTQGGEEYVEIRYNLNLGSFLNRLAAPFMPRLSVWFDSQETGSWVGHRMPLFSKGPTVMVMRSGINPSALGLAEDPPASVRDR